MNMTGLFVLGVALLLPLCLAGCGEKPEVPAAAPAPKAAAPVVKTAPAPKEAVENLEPPKYVYDPAGRRDPFQPLILDKVPTAKEKTAVSMAPPEENLTPLQQYEIAQFRLIGVIIGKGQPTAMVVAPDGKAYVLKKGVKVGKNNGVVKSINSSTVFIEELYQDLSGEMLKNELEIKLPKREGA